MLCCWFSAGGPLRVGESLLGSRPSPPINIVLQMCSKSHQCLLLQSVQWAMLDVLFCVSGSSAAFRFPAVAMLLSGQARVFAVMPAARPCFLCS